MYEESGAHALHGKVKAEEAHLDTLRGSVENRGGFEIQHFGIMPCTTEKDGRSTTWLCAR